MLAPPDVLDEMRHELDLALAEGTTARKFVKVLEGRVGQSQMTGKGQDKQVSSRQMLETIYRTDMALSYGARRYRQQMRVAESRPYWQYVAVLDPSTREQHRALNDKVFMYDDEFWDYFYPPNDYNCRCRVRTLSERKLEREGLHVEKTDKESLKAAQIVRAAGGRAACVNHPVARYFGHDAAGKPFTISTEAGFGYNPGKVQPRWDIISWPPDCLMVRFRRKWHGYRMPPQNNQEKEQ